MARSSSRADRRQREQLVRMLSEGGAHLPAQKVLARFPVAARGAQPGGAPHTAWQLLEHMRIAQWDILRFSLDPEHVSPTWPEGYWPATAAPPDAQAWNRSVESFLADLRALSAVARDARRDLLAPLAHAPAATWLGGIYLVASHNSYHLGQLELLRLAHAAGRKRHSKPNQRTRRMRSRPMRR